MKGGKLLTIKAEGGVPNEEATELGDYRPGDFDGVQVPPSDSLAAAEPVPSPQPIFLTVCDPNTGRALTVALPFGVACAVTHALTGPVIGPITSAFPSAEPSDESESDSGPGGCVSARA